MFSHQIQTLRYIDIQNNERTSVPKIKRTIDLVNEDADIPDEIKHHILHQKSSGQPHTKTAEIPTIHNKLRTHFEELPQPDEGSGF